MRELLLHRRRKQPLVNAHVDYSRMILAPLHQPLVEGIHDLLVVEAVGML
jgi:hypothetical protein